MLCVAHEEGTSVQHSTKSKVRHVFSLTAKLFGLMVFLLLVSLGVQTYLSVKTLRDQLFTNVNASVLQRAQAGANQVGAILETWAAQAVAGLTGVRSANDPGLATAVMNVARTNRELIGVEVYLRSGLRRVAGFREFKDVTRLEDRSVDEVLRTWDRQLPARVRSFAESQSQYRLVDLDVEQGLPIAVLFMRVAFNSGREECIFALVAWSSRLVAALGGAGMGIGRLLGSDGRVVLGPGWGQGVFSIGGSNLWTYLQGQSVTSGYKAMRLGSDTELFGFARLPLYDQSLVLVQMSAAAAYGSSEIILVQTALTACLLILIAMLVSYLGARGVTRKLRQVTEVTQRIAQGDFSLGLDERGRDEVAVLASSVNHMSGQIIHLMRSQMDKARLDQELATARLVQGTFFPRRNYQSQFLNISGSYHPATECGGDWWGRFTAPDDREFVLVGDAMGHGASAAMLTAMAYTCASVVAEMIHAARGHEIPCSPKTILEQLNRTITEALSGKVLMTFFVAALDPRRGKMVYANAGHNPPILMRRKSLAITGASDPLGVSVDSTYEEHSLDLRPGDRLVLFTDGLLECRSPAGQPWGRKNLVKEVKALPPSANVDEMRERLLARAFAHYGSRPIADDVTVVVLEVSRTWVPSASSGRVAS